MKEVREILDRILKSVAEKLEQARALIAGKKPANPEPTPIPEEDE